MTKKTKLIANLSLAAVLCATTSAGLLATVNASAESLSTDKLFSVNSGTTVTTANAATGSVTHTGIKFDPETTTTAISGDIIGTFTKEDDAKFQFSFPGDYTAEDGTATNGEG